MIDTEPIRTYTCPLCGEENHNKAWWSSHKEFCRRYAVIRDDRILKELKSWAAYNFLAPKSITFPDYIAKHYETDWVYHWHGAAPLVDIVMNQVGLYELRFGKIPMLARRDYRYHVWREENGKFVYFGWWDLTLYYQPMVHIMDSVRPGDRRWSDRHPVLNTNEEKNTCVSE